MDEKKAPPVQREESVAYNHPPKASRFQKGQSGNPSGRPRGAPTLKADLVHELSEPTEFCEGNRSLILSKQRALVKRLVNAALKGDAKATAVVFSFCARL